MERINNEWYFTETWSDDFASGAIRGKPVRLPHNPRTIPLHCAAPSDYEMISGYRKSILLPADINDHRVFLQLDGAAHIADVYLNGICMGTHRCGYTAFRVELTAAAHSGENTIAIRLNSTEDPSIPPFGNVIDYLTYAGLYRDAWIDIRPKRMITDLFVYAQDLKTACAHAELDGALAGDYVEYTIYPESDPEDRFTRTAGINDSTVKLTVDTARPWFPTAPILYVCRAELKDTNGVVIDKVDRTFGFRTAEFKNDGFYLNGSKFFLRGLNRHQCYPYSGYAVPEKLQREDVRILQEELSCNAVRTSHYPQSRYFLDECDRRGMLVFTELPGWQHVGDETWKQQACENLREMLIENRNHPSIILWGVRINESRDDHDFYVRTNAIVHNLDPSRATSGVRYIEKSELLEDVYAFNDFSHIGNNPGCKSRAAVLKEPRHPFLISEHNGHMYPTKPWDSWSHRQSQALRHARVLNDAIADGEHAGCFGWCMFDYPTHKDFGSGDRVCYHGVMDAFRNPKLAASLYAAQGDDRTVLDVTSSMDIGDYPGGQIGTFYVLTNADEVRMYKNDSLVSILKSDNDFTALPHPPIRVDDTIGNLLQLQEGFSEKKAKRLRKALAAAAKQGASGMALGTKLLFADCMLRYHMTMQDGLDLYGKYVGNWGGNATRWRFEAIRDGKPAATVTRSSNTDLQLECIPSHTDLYDGDVYDIAAIRIRIKDAFGNQVPYAQLPVTFKTEGPIDLVGPDTVCAEGGACGTYVRTIGKPGKATLIVSTPQTESVRIGFNVII